MHQLIDMCDTKRIGLWWKAGGALRDGDNLYGITPLKERLPAQWDGPSGLCNIDYKFVYDDHFITGRGWLSSDHGKSSRTP